MKLPTHEELLARIDAFLERHGLTASTFGREATGEPNLVTTLRGGRSPSLRTMHRLADFMAERDREAGFGAHAVADTAPADAASPGNPGDLTAQVAA